ncbi:MAG: UDP-N-acetylmuramoyl-tripeptide--D-alanyl-D-alanine ligase [Flavobacteriaceae bacterium]
MTNFNLEGLYELWIDKGYKYCTDTRKIETGALFFALKGSNFNGNTYALKALEQGCSYAIVDQEMASEDPRLIKVDDVLTCLQKLANHHRKQFDIPVIALTGSNGKTTSKELIAACLSSRNVLATLGNLNNHLGVPFTLLRLRSHHELALIEMGANHQGEISELCDIAEPDFGYITNFGKAHMEGFGGIEGIIKGKTELYRYLIAKGGSLFLNSADPIQYSYKDQTTSICFGIKPEDSPIELVSANPLLKFLYQDKLYSTHLVGTYNFINISAAICIASYFDIPVQNSIKAITNYIPENNRSQLNKVEKAQVVLDAYNANPSSMRVALESFFSQEQNRKVLILGDMFELGAYSLEEHKNLIDYLRDKQFEKVILLGTHFNQAYSLSQPLDNLESFQNKTEFTHTEFYKSMFNRDHYILIKGSRGMKLEDLIP